MIQNRGLTEETLQNLHNMIFNISLNMLYNETEAEDATQQIMLKVLEGFPKFKGDSKLGTWAYRVARNFLLDHKQKMFNQPLSFDIFAQDVQSFTPYRGEWGLSPAEEKIYVEQVKVGCTLAMLQCLDKESRVVFILGGIFHLPGDEAAESCGLSHSNYRKKLSRTKQKVRNFLSANCGLVSDDSPCRCHRRLLIAKERGHIDFERDLYQTSSQKIMDFQSELNRADQEMIFSSNPFLEREVDVDRATLLNQLSILSED